MAYQIVVAKNLTEEMIAAGEHLTRLLIESRFPVSASLWLYIPETQGWRLFIASPEVAKLGPLKAYESIHSVISKISQTSPKIGLEDIAVVHPDDQIISLLRTVVKTGRDISRIRFSQNVINGTLIEDALIYRMV